MRPVLVLVWLACACRSGPARDDPSPLDSDVDVRDDETDGLRDTSGDAGHTDVPGGTGLQRPDTGGVLIVDRMEAIQRASLWCVVSTSTLDPHPRRSLLFVDATTEDFVFVPVMLPWGSIVGASMTQSLAKYDGGYVWTNREAYFWYDPTTLSGRLVPMTERADSVVFGTWGGEFAVLAGSHHTEARLGMFADLDAAARFVPSVASGARSVGVADNQRGTIRAGEIVLAPNVRSPSHLEIHRAPDFVAERVELRGGGVGSVYGLSATDHHLVMMHDGLATSVQYLWVYDRQGTLQRRLALPSRGVAHDGVYCEEGSTP